MSVLREQAVAQAVALVRTALAMVAADAGPGRGTVDAARSLIGSLVEDGFAIVGGAAQGGALPVGAVSAYDADGMTAVDADGCVRFRVVDAIRAEIRARTALPDAVRADALRAIGERFTCYPALAKLTEDDPRYWIIMAESSRANMRGWIPSAETEFVNRYQVVNAGAPLPQDRIRVVPYSYVEGARALPLAFRSVDECVADVQRTLAQVLGDHARPGMSAPGVDFSPGGRPKIVGVGPGWDGNGAPSADDMGPKL